MDHLDALYMQAIDELNEKSAVRDQAFRAAYRADKERGYSSVPPGDLWDAYEAALNEEREAHHFVQILQDRRRRYGRR